MMNLKKALTAEYAEEHGVKPKNYDLKAILPHGDMNLFSNDLFPLRTSVSSAVQLPFIV